MNSSIVYLRRFGFLPLLAVLVFLPWAGTYFVADDWPVIARNTHLSAEDLPHLFMTMHAGWYRPVFELYVRLCWKLFGLHPVGYHLMSIFLYAITTVLIGLVGMHLSGDRRIGILSGLLFSVLACHTEPVMWISSANELLAGAFTLCSMATYIAFRKKRRWQWFLASTLSLALAVLSKETALFLPVMFLTYDILFPNMLPGRIRESRRLLAPASLLVLAGMLGIARMLLGSPYSVQSSAAQLLKNLVYYLTMHLLVVPAAFPHTVASLSFGAGVSLLALIVVVGCMLRRENSWPPDNRPVRTLLFAIIWTLAALAPVLTIVTERTTFLSSCGVALGLAAFCVYGWDLARRIGGVYRQVILLALSLFLMVNVVSLTHRSWWWAQAGQVSQSTLAQLQERTNELPSSTEVWLVNLPDQLKYAYVFRNAFPTAAELLGFSQEIHAILDSEFEQLSAQDQAAFPARLDSAPNLVWFRWEDSEFIKP